MRGDELLAELRVEGEDAEATLDALLAQHRDADAVRLVEPAPEITEDDLKPLRRVSRRHGVAIDVLRRSNG